MLAILETSAVVSLAVACVNAEFAFGQIAERYAKLRGPWPPSAIAEMERFSEEHKALVARLVATPAQTVGECQHKALALRTCPDNGALLTSLLNDIEGLPCAVSPDWPGIATAEMPERAAVDLAVFSNEGGLPCDP